MTHARRTDANLSAIVDAFRALGCSVHVLNGVVDLLIGYGGLTVMVEVKDGAKPPSARQLTPAQKKFSETWTGGIRIVQNVDDVQACVKTIRRWHAALCRDSLV